MSVFECNLRREVAFIDLSFRRVLPRPMLATAGGEPQAERRRLANSRSLAVVHDVSDAEAENIFVGVVPDHDSLSKLPANCR